MPTPRNHEPAEEPVVADGEGDDGNSSPESAALARGAARTAATRGATKAAAGGGGRGAGAGATRMPIRAPVGRGPSPPPRPLLKSRPAPPPRRGGARLPRSRPGAKSGADAIARASDRASVGLDVLSAGLEHHHDPHANPPKYNPPKASSSSFSSWLGMGLISKIPPHTKLHAVVHAGLEQRDHNTAVPEPSNTRHHGKEDSKSNHHPRIKGEWLLLPAAHRVISACKVFATNTVLGMAVFSTYESTIEHLAPTSSSTPGEDGVRRPSRAARGDDDGSGADEGEASALPPTDAMDRATLPQHLLAGAAGGAAHAALSLALEVKLEAGISSSSSSSSSSSLLSSSSSPSAGGTSTSRRMRVPAVRYSASTFLHHSLSHSVLFGSYQLSKRSLARLRSHHRRSAGGNGVGGDDDALRFATIAVAGGLAGQCQHVVGHLSERWLGLAAVDVAAAATANLPASSSPSSLRRLVLSSSSWPTWRSTALTFPLSAVGFLAFEYGKLMMTGNDDGVDGRA